MKSSDRAIVLACLILVVGILCILAGATRQSWFILFCGIVNIVNGAICLRSGLVMREHGR